MDQRIPFNRPHVPAAAHELVAECLASGHQSGDGPFTRAATQELRTHVGGGEVLLTTSCTHALEMAALLLDVGPGDEVIMPSFAFVSAANAFVLRGATVVFVDCRPDTFNLDERLLEGAITPRTKAVVLIHYGGVACAMDAIGSIAARHGIAVVEDNAHGLGATFGGRPLGSFGALATQSFHETKNVQCGEGGALVVNDPQLLQRAEILREKGTNRTQFARGEVDKYRWLDVGSSYLPGDLLAALLCAQLGAFDDIQARRHAVWNAYDTELAAWRADHGVQAQHVPADVAHPAHLYSLLLPSREDRDRFVRHMADAGITAPFHYVPLHDAPGAQGRSRVAPSGCAVTDDVSARLARLPLFPDLEASSLARIVEAAVSFVPRRPHD